MKDYKTTGQVAPQKVKSHNNNSAAMITQPGAGHHIVITDVLLSATGSGGQSFHEGDDSSKDSDVLFYFPDEGVSNFVTPIMLGENKALWMGTDSMNATVCYYIQRSTSLSSK